MPIIDFHTHLADRWFNTPTITEETFIQSLDQCGVDIACIFTLMGFYSDCPRYNDHLAARSRVHPSRFIPFITVDPKLGTEAVREMERCAADPVFRGVKFHNWCQAIANSMVKETMLDILRIAARHRLPVLFHDGTPPYATTFQIAALARWVPEATIVLGHGGLADYVTVAGESARDLHNLYICLCCPKAGDLLYLLDTAGTDKVMWGSDFGFSDWRMLAERLDDVYQAKLDPVTEHKVFYANAARLLQLHERPLK